MIQEIDQNVSLWMSAMAGYHPIADFLFVVVANLISFKLLPLFTLLLWLWGKGKPFGREHRGVTAAMLGGMLAITISRLFQNFVPPRLRPADDPFYHFSIGIPQALKDASSFPSDTLSIATALATGLFLANRRVGVMAYGWCVIVAAGKLYSGFHFVSDIVAGTIIGTTASGVAALIVDRWSLAARLERAVTTYPQWALAIGFIAAFQITTYFDDLRTAASALRRLV